MAGSEPVTSPDQRKPVNQKPVRIGAVVSILITLTLLFGNHKGRVEQIWLLAFAGGMALMLIVDWVLRRNGLRS